MAAKTTFTGGKKLQAYLAGIAKAAQVTNPITLNVGFLEGATYPDGTSVPMVAAINEFGAPSRGQPPRPFFRRMIKDKKGQWGKQLGKIIVANGYDAQKSMRLMGEVISGDLRESITNFTTPGIKQSTAQRKGFTKPLVDTGHMLASVDYEVKQEK